MKKLNCNQANRLDLVDYLHYLGHRPSKIHNNDYWYLSPLRQEKTPSFKVNRKFNLWYDHGIGEGGTLTDFGIRYKSCSVTDLLQELRIFATMQAFSFQPQHSHSSFADEKESSSDNRITILSVQPLQNEGLLEYLKRRSLDIPTAQRFCKEVDFRLYNKTHKAIGFPNDRGGFELRSDTFKGSSSPKTITLIETDPKSRSIHVLEGFTDFLSLLNLKEQETQNNFLVLNSLSFVSSSLGLLKGFDEVMLYLDYDIAGRKATDEIKQALPQAKDASLFYNRYKDLNEYLMLENKHLNIQQSHQPIVTIKPSKIANQEKAKNTKPRKRKNKGLRR